MALQIQGENGVVAQVGGTAFRAQHVHPKPLEYGALGHYRVSSRFALVNAQAAASRLFEMRNTGPNLIIPTRLNVKWIQTAAHTAAILDSLDVFKVTGFTAVDTTNTVTPTVSVKRGASMAAAPGGAALRHVTIAGAAAGMTGGTLTKDGSPFAQLQKWFLAALPTGGEIKADILDAFDDVNGTHPWVFVQNEGFEIENRVLLGAAAGSEVIVDFSYAEVASF